MRTMTIALAKGRLADEAVSLLEASGLDCRVVRQPKRKLILEDPGQKLRFILAKPADVPTYVDYGAADLGIVGKDTLLEENRSLYEVLDCGFGACRLCVCGFEAAGGQPDRQAIQRVATKYPRIARDYFEGQKKQSVDIIRLNGSVELAPLIGLAEVIVDIVESGRTLRENGLAVLETITPVSARMVVNRVSMNIKSDRIMPLIQAVKKTLEQRQRKD